MRLRKPDAILIAGPTASGKSKLALELAEKHDGEIINTDSMQVYPVLSVLTARPSDEDLNTVPHHLYGHADIEKPYSVSRWLKDVQPVVEDLRTRNKVPIFVGGTGLYFRALLEGLSVVPEIPADIRSQIRADLLKHGPQDLHERLAALDPGAAERLKPGDGHRIARALEVVAATGKPISFFHEQKDEPGVLIGENVEKILIMPERSVLHERINKRAGMMLEQGALDEVKTLLALDLPAEATVWRAIGVVQLQNYLLGKESLDATRELLKTATRQYAKRQSTWFRNQFDENWRDRTV